MTNGLVAIGVAIVLFILSRSRTDTVRKENGQLIIKAPDGSNVAGRFSDTTLQWWSECREVGAEVGVDPRILLTIIENESRGVPQPGALDEHGIMQLRPIAVRDVAQNTGLPNRPPSELSDREGILYGAHHYRIGKRRTRRWPDSMLPGTHYAALRVYNAGIGKARKSSAAAQQYAMRAIRRIGFSRQAE